MDSILYALDTGFRMVRIIVIPTVFMQTACEHKRTVMIARRDGVEYVECLDCREIFEAEDLEPVTVEADEE